MIYIVHCAVDAEIDQDWKTWMEHTHIPDVMETGLFVSCSMTRDEAADSEASVAYRMIYRLASKRAFERYQSEFAPALQADHSERYAGRVSARRDVLPVIAHFDFEGPRHGE